jgi:hypothetical protein
LPNFVSNLGDIQFGGGNLLVNKTDSKYSDTDFGKFVSIGATDRETGATLKVGERKIKQIFAENDREEPCKMWSDGQDIFFETTLMETSIENFVLSLGGDLNAIGDQTTAAPYYKFYRGGELALPKFYPMIYDVPDSDTPTLKTRLIMPRCEIIGAVDFQMKDTDAHSLKLTVRLHRPLELPGIPQLIINGGFEQGSGHTFTGWTKGESGNAYVYQWNFILVHGGLRCVQLFTVNGGTASVEQTIAVDPTKRYWFSFFHLGNLPNVPLTVTLGSNSYTVVTDQNPSQWREYRLLFFPTGANILVKISSSATGMFSFIDDATLKEFREGDETSSLVGTKFEVRREHA